MRSWRTNASTDRCSTGMPPSAASCLGSVVPKRVPRPPAAMIAVTCTAADCTYKKLPTPNLPTSSLQLASCALGRLSSGEFQPFGDLLLDLRDVPIRVVLT